MGWFEEVSDTYLQGPKHGFHYDPMLDTYWVTPVDFALVDINNLGQMVGEDWSELAVVAWKLRYYRRHGTSAFFYDGLGGEPQPLLPLPGDEIASVTGINDAGLIIGFSYDESLLSDNPLPPYIVTPVVWQVTSEGITPPIALPLLDNHFIGRPEGIGPANANGVCAIVGA